MAIEPTLIRPRDLPAASQSYPNDAMVADDGSAVHRVTPVQIVNAGAPVPSEAVAMAGTNNTARMTPLMVHMVSKQNPKSWADFSRFMVIPDGSVVAFNGVQFVRDRASNIAGLGPGAGWKPFGVTRQAHFDNDAAYLSFPSVARNRESLSALDLTPAGLDAAIRNREATNTDAASITADVMEVLTACANKSWKLIFPAGRFFFSKKLVAEKPLTIVGAGMNRSDLRWDTTAASAGIKISAGGIVEYSEVRDLTMRTNAVTPKFTAIEFDYSSLVSSGTTLPRAMTHGSVEGVSILSFNNALASGWGNGIIATSMLGMNISRCRINGFITGANGTAPQSVSGVLFGGDGQPVQLVIDRSFISGFQDAVLTKEAEGIFITSSEFVNVQRGYRADNAVAESGFAMTGTHVNCLESCLDFTRMQDVIVNGNFLYNRASSTIMDAFIVHNSGSGFTEIVNNTFRRYQGAEGTDGIVIRGGQRVNIGHNVWYINGQSSTERSIIIDAAATNITVARQTYAHSSGSFEQITNNSTTAQFEEFMNFTGDLDTICTLPAMARQTHMCGVGVTNAPPAWTNTRLGVITTLSDLDGGAVQTGRHRLYNSGQEYRRTRSAGGVWSSWQ